MCGINAQEAQRHFHILYTSLKLIVLLHKTELVNFPMATTVYRFKFSLFQIAQQKRRIPAQFLMLKTMHVILKAQVSQLKIRL